MSEHLRRVLALHFDPEQGSPYWLERERELGFDVRARVHSVDDLALFGAFDPAQLTTRPFTDFVPRALLARGGLITAETGGTTGIPCTTAYTAADFHAAFVAPFLDATAHLQFGAGHWLWIGPSGPHVIGKAAQRIARFTTASDALSIDFDPRWFRRLAAGSLARERYLDHVLEQAMRILRQHDIRYLFATPVVLQALVVALDARRREAIRFVYLGGMPVSGATRAALAEALPSARFLAGYGNTLFGVCHEAGAGRGADDCVYYPPAARLVARVIGDGGATPVAFGTRGRLVMSRLDASGFLPWVIERDRAVRHPPCRAGGAEGLGDPRPPQQATLHIDHGIY